MGTPCWLHPWAGSKDVEGGLSRIVHKITHRNGVDSLDWQQGRWSRVAIGRAALEYTSQGRASSQAPVTSLMPPT